MIKSVARISYFGKESPAKSLVPAIHVNPHVPAEAYHELHDPAAASQL
jgi:hypothetical protein